MQYKEHELQVACLKWFKLQYPTKTIFCIQNARKSNNIQGYRLKQSGVLSGVADLFLMHGCSMFNGMFIEMKYGKGKQSEAQQEFEDKCWAEGYFYVICDSFDKFKLEVEKYLSL
jgi:hypothetical protein